MRSIMHSGLLEAIRCDCTRNQRQFSGRAAAERTLLPFGAPSLGSVLRVGPAIHTRLDPT
jgi:hypothetical protein